MVIVLLFASKAIQDFLGARAGERTVGCIDGLQWKARHGKIETRISIDGLQWKARHGVGVHRKKG